MLRTYVHTFLYYNALVCCILQSLLYINNERVSVRTPVYSCMIYPGCQPII